MMRTMMQPGLYCEFLGTKAGRSKNSIHTCVGGGIPTLEVWRRNTKYSYLCRWWHPNLGGLVTQHLFLS
jgi:hypothetical protein